MARVQGHGMQGLSSIGNFGTMIFISTYGKGSLDMYGEILLRRSDQDATPGLNRRDISPQGIKVTAPSVACGRTSSSVRGGSLKTWAYQALHEVVWRKTFRTLPIYVHTAPNCKL